MNISNLSIEEKKDIALQLYTDKQRKLIFNYVKKESSTMILIPESVKQQARLGLILLRNGYKGGTKTGWNRAKQLASNKYIDLNSLMVMRAWFARHGPDARNGGTSYPGYRKWIEHGKPIDRRYKNKYRGAVSWLIWGGDEAYKWLKTKKVRIALKKAYKNKRESSKNINLKFENSDAESSDDDYSLDNKYVKSLKQERKKKMLRENEEHKKK